MRKLPFISETCYTYEEALAHVEEIRRTGLITLGGDMLTPEGEYTYINWYYEPREPESACSESCDHAAKFISELADREGYLYAFVVSSYEACSGVCGCRQAPLPAGRKKAKGPRIPGHVMHRRTARPTEQRRIISGRT